MNQNNIFNKIKENNISKEKFRSKINYILNNKNSKKIIGAIVALIVAIIILIISIILLSNSDKRSNVLRKESWEEFVINIDGNTIKMGEVISSVESMGFTSTDENYEGELNQNFTSGGLAFNYKESDTGNNKIFFSAYNSSDSTKVASECELNGLELSQEFYKTYDVTLPGGLLLNEELNIKKITTVWGEPTNKSDNLYEWIKDNSKIRIYTNENNTIFSIIYDYQKK